MRHTGLVIASPPLQLIACPHPFSTERIERQVPSGCSITDLLLSLELVPDAIFARVFIDDHLVPKAEWEWARPTAGQLVTIRVIPTGGGGGSKDALRVVAMIAVVAVAIAVPYFAPASWGITAGTLGGSLFTGGFLIAGSLAVAALIPPPKQSFETLSATSPTLSLTGSSNQLVPYAPIPRVYGQHRLFPPMAARPYTEVIGNDQYLHLLFCCGYGPLALSDLQIGQTPITNFTQLELEIRYGYATDLPMSLFPTDVFEDNLSILLTSAGSWAQRTSQALAKALSVDVVFPSGLGDFRDGSDPYTVQVAVEYRLVGTAPWIDVLGAVATASTVQTAFTGANNDLVFTAQGVGSYGNNLVVQFSSGAALVVKANTQIGPRTQRETRLVFITIQSGVTTSASVKAAIEAHALAASFIAVAHAAGNNGTGAITLPPKQGAAHQLAGGLDAVSIFSVTDHRSTQLRFSRTWQVAAVGQYEIRLRKVTADATDPLIVDRVYWSTLRTIQSGAPVSKRGLCLVAMKIKATDQLNGVVDQFNCLAQSLLPDWNGSTWELAPTSNPASIYRDVLQGSANARPLADSRLDLTTLQAFHTRCATKDLLCNVVIDFRTTVFELARDVLAAGRASFALRDGTYSVVEDLPQTIPIQHLTPRNSWGFRGTKTFVEQPHALKTRFVNPDKDWQQDERFVYADGYSAANATKFETFDLMGVTNAEQAWKLGRYHLAVAQLRPETYELTTDIENLVCTRGDLVRVVHDVPLFGAGYGRIKSLVLDGGNNATAFTLDDLITMNGALSYAVRFRKSDGTSLVQQVVTVAGEQSTFTFTVAIPSATKPAVGDLALLGVLNAESVEMIVRSIEPGPDLTAKLLLVDAAPAVLTAESGTIPAFNSQITLPAAALSPVPQPILDQVQSDETVLFRDVDGSYQSRILLTLHFASGFRLPVTNVQVEYRPTGSTESQWVQFFAPVSGMGTEVTIAPVQDGQTYDVRVRAVNRDTGATSDWLTLFNHTVIGKTTPPPDVPLLIFDGDLLRWSYPAPPRDLAGFILKSRPGIEAIWDEGVTLHDHLVAEMFYPLVTDGLVRVFMVKAVDVAQNESTGVASVIYAGGPLVLGNLAMTIDKRAQGFPDTKVNCTVVSGDLKADGATLFWTNDPAAFWTVDPATMWTGGYKTMTYTFTVSPPSNWVTGKLRIGLGITAGSWSLLYRPDAQNSFWTTDAALFWTTDAALFWVGSRPDFMTWPGAIGPMTPQSYEFQIQASGGAIQAVITGLQILFDMPDLRESIIDLIIPIGGRRVPITKSYQLIKTVQVTPQTPGRVPVVLDKDYLAGPFVELDDLTGADAEGIVDAELVGY